MIFPLLEQQGVSGETEAGSQKRNSTDEAGESSNANKITRLTNFEVPEFLVANNIETETELFAQTHSQKAAG